MDTVNYFCINLASRKDRWEECKKEFLHQNINIKRWNATPLPQNRRFWAWLSHREIIEHAKAQKWEYVWVFEDDVFFMKNNFQYFVNKALDELLNKKWYILYFWWLMCRNSHLEKESDVNSLFKVEGLMWAHALIYHKDFYDIYLKLHPDKYTDKIKKLYIKNKYKAFDEWMALDFQNKFPCYISKYFLAGQRDNFSNIENKFIISNYQTVMRFYIYKHWLWSVAKKIWDFKEKLLFWVKKMQQYFGKNSKNSTKKMP